MDWAENWILKNGLESRYNEWLDKVHDYDYSDEYTYHNGSTFLEIRGWIRLQGSRHKNTTPYVKDAQFEKFSDAQYFTLSNICKKYHADFKTVIECSEWYSFNGKRNGEKNKTIYNIKL